MKSLVCQIVRSIIIDGVGRSPSGEKCGSWNLCFDGIYRHAGVPTFSSQLNQRILQAQEEQKFYSSPFPRIGLSIEGDTPYFYTKCKCGKCDPAWFARGWTCYGN